MGAGEALAVLPVPTFAAGAGFEFGDVAALGLLFAGVALFLAVGTLSQQGERAFSAAVVYLLLGAILSLALGLLGVELLEPLEDAAVIERLTEFAVIVSLFSAGLKIERRLRWDEWRAPAMLLAVAMPLTIAGVAAFASLAMGLSLGAAVLLGAVLSPTDPVLADDVQIGPPGDREEPEAQFALTAEAGANDGLAFPFVFLGIFIASRDGTAWLAEWALADVLYASVAGVAVGALLGRQMGRMVLGLRARGWLRPELDGWLAIATVLVVYGFTEAIGAYGFLAAFAGGLAFRRHERHHEYHGRVHAGAETVENFSELAIVLLLGSTVTLAGLGEPGLSGWLLVPLLLVAIRPLAAVVSLARTRLDLRERLFVGWFGVRGIGSFYYAAVAIESGVLAADEAAILYWTVIACVGVSILAHGFTARPATRRLGRRGRSR